MSKKKNSSDIDNNVVGFLEKTRAYVNDNFSPYYRGLWGKCQSLKNDNVIKWLWSAKGEIRVRRDDTSPVLKIFHDNDLSVNFLDCNFNN